MEKPRSAACLAHMLMAAFLLCRAELLLWCCRASVGVAVLLACSPSVAIAFMLWP